MQVEVVAQGMSYSSLPFSPHEATRLILKQLPSRRMRDVLEKRFGLTGGKKKTLDAIGKEYKITRERVRQIEHEALKHVSRQDNLAEVQKMLQAIHEHVKRHGEVMSESHLFATLAEERYYPHVALLLDAGDSFRRIPETDHFHARWVLNQESAASCERTMAAVAKELDAKKETVPEQALHDMIVRHMKIVSGKEPSSESVQAYAATSKLIRRNPYGEYGLVSWPSVSPSGVKDKAYVALAKSGKPMHFRDVAAAINKAGWSKKGAHPQTVHNELIKDARFVLVGRGLYALCEWGYEPGSVRDILVSVFKNAARPLSRDEVVTLALEKRFVKVPTILLNLQNAKMFKKTNDGKFLLA